MLRDLAVIAGLCWFSYIAGNVLWGAGGLVALVVLGAVVLWIGVAVALQRRSAVRGYAQDAESEPRA